MPHGKLWKPECYISAQWWIQDFPEVMLTPKETPTYYLTIYFRKLHEKKDILAQRGRKRRPPPDPPMVQDNVHQQVDFQDTMPKEFLSSKVLILSNIFLFEEKLDTREIETDRYNKEQ